MVIIKGQYELLGLLGKGGFGETFLARDLHLPSKPKRALKKLVYPDTDPEQYKVIEARFEREAVTLENLGRENHPQIPKLYAYFTHDHDYYLAQEFIEGETVQKQVEDAGPFDEQKVRGILIRLLDVLEFIHSRGIIHRDIHPKNVILTKRGGQSLPVLIDFGAVREVASQTLDADGNPVSSTIIFRHEEYTSPEQIMGRATYASDLFSLAKTAVFMLTGQNPSRLTAKKGLRAYAPEVSDGLEGIIDKAIEYSLKVRYRNAGEMLEALQAAASDKEKRPPAPPPPVAQPSSVLPDGHSYLERGPQPGCHVLLREADGQAVLLLEKRDSLNRTILIDKYLVTCSQFATFLNDDGIKERTRIGEEGSVRIISSKGGNLIACDARTYWEDKRVGGTAWGLTYDSGRWKPLLSSERLPVTLVTTHGACMYAAWARGLGVDNVDVSVGLPNEADWEVAAFWDFEAGRKRQFPWGDEWDIFKLNSLCYWARRELFSQDHTYKKWLGKATPTPVGDFTQGASPSGMMDALGNVWEWTAERDHSGRFMIKGGAYLCVRTNFESSSPIYRQPGSLAQMIGFRCGWVLA